MIADAWFWVAVGAVLPLAGALLLCAPRLERWWSGLGLEELELPWGDPEPELPEELPDCRCSWKSNDAPLHMWWCPRAGRPPVETSR